MVQSYFISVSISKMVKKSKETLYFCLLRTIKNKNGVTTFLTSDHEGATLFK